MIAFTSLPGSHRHTRGVAVAVAGLAVWLFSSLPVHARGAPAVGRVISTSPIDDNGRPAGYSVTYEYGGRQYTMRTAVPPGPTVPIEAGPYGVLTYPVAPQSFSAVSPEPVARPESYEVRPEPGVVVSSEGVPYTTAAPAHAAYPPPVDVTPGYAYPAPYMYPRIGFSVNLGYSRGWHRGWR